MKPIFWPVAALILISACDKKAEEAPAPATKTLASAGKSIAYTCDKDLAITAIHGTDLEGKADLALIIQGTDVRFTRAEAAGEVWTTPHGLEAGRAMVWRVTGDEALLQQLPSADLSDLTKAETVRTCSVKTQPDQPISR